MIVSVLAALTSPSAALAWGYAGHEIIAEIARAYMTPAALAKVDALLQADISNSLTAHDMASEAVWADAYRGAGHKEASSWHFVNIELDHPDVKSARFAFPPAGTSASSGPADDCIINKLDEFISELRNPATAPEERLTALKYVLHFVGDLHQPLHAADNHDRGGNCVSVALGGPRTQNLHSYWDTGVLAPLGPDPVAASKALLAAITPADVRAWSAGTPRTWADESFQLARTTAYTAGSKPGCGTDQGPVSLPAGYADAAAKVADTQLEKAGARLAMVLNAAFGR